jgi:outer membrane protein assembly factor BamB
MRSLLAVALLLAACSPAESSPPGPLKVEWTAVERELFVDNLTVDGAGDLVGVGHEQAWEGVPGQYARKWSRAGATPVWTRDVRAGDASPGGLRADVDGVARGWMFGWAPNGSEIGRALQGPEQLVGGAFAAQFAPDGSIQRGWWLAPALPSAISRVEAAASPSSDLLLVAMSSLSYEVDDRPSRRATLALLAADGTTRWSVHADTSMSLPMVAASPTAGCLHFTNYGEDVRLGDKILPKAPFVARVDMASGAVSWVKELAESSKVSSLAATADGACVIAYGNATFTGPSTIEAVGADGAVRWSHAPTQSYAPLLLARANGNVVLTPVGDVDFGTGPLRGTNVVELRGSDGALVYAHSLSEAGTMWIRLAVEDARGIVLYGFSDVGRELDGHWIPASSVFLMGLSPR